MTNKQDIRSDSKMNVTPSIADQRSTGVPTEVATLAAEVIKATTVVSPEPASVATPDTVLASTTPTVASPLSPPQIPYQPSKLDIWSTRAAAWAQVVTVFVVVFGYLYTVRPVFQLQLLQEQAAQLQIDNDTAKQKLAQTELAQEGAQTKLAALDTELKNVAKSRDSLVVQLNRESQQEVKAIDEMARSQTQLSTQAGALLIAQRRLLYTRFSTLFSWWSLGFSLRAYMDPDDTDGKWISKAQAEWPNPFLRYSQILDKLEKDNTTYREFPAELLVPLRRILEDNKAALLCEPVNLESLRQDYVKEMSTVDTDSRNQAVAELNKQREEASTKGQRMIITDDDVKRFARADRVGLVYAIGRKYESKVNALRDVCVSKAKPIIDLMSKRI